jgi:hypothetical protein
MPALAIHKDIEPVDLRRQARRERDGGERAADRDRRHVGGDGPGERDSAWRDGPANLARLGSALERARHRRAVQPTAAGTAAQAQRGSDGLAERVDPARPRSGHGQSPAMAVVDLCRLVEQRWDVVYSVKMHD